jgi:hypothetical protein
MEGQKQKLGGNIPNENEGTYIKDTVSFWKA